MAELRNLFTISASDDKDILDACNMLADSINRSLPKECHCFVVSYVSGNQRLTGIAGGTRATEAFKRLNAELEKVK